MSISRSERLLSLLQALRGRRQPVTAAWLAVELGVSPRTIYRDIAALAGQGAVIEGEAGLGYLLQPSFFLPPLMLSAEEAEAIMLGLRLVQRRGDSALSCAAESAIGKVAEVLPADIGIVVEGSGLLAGPAPPSEHLREIREAMLAEERIVISYPDARGGYSERTVWPVAVGFFTAAEVLAAWCERRSAFRHFRLDRIRRVHRTGERLPRRRAVLLAEWRRNEEASATTADRN